MIKSKIDLEVAKRLYEKYKNLHKVAEELHTSHIRLSNIFKENGIEINNIGKSRVMSEKEIDEAINDYLNNHLKMEEISRKYNVRIHKLRDIFRVNDVIISKWNGHVKKEKPPKIVRIKKIVETKECPYCGWKTKDVSGKAHSYQMHLVHKHNIDIDEHLTKYPEDFILVKDEKSRRDRKIQCKICGKWLYTIDNRHLAKHGLDKTEYVETFYGTPIISDSTKKKLQGNMKKMMENDKWERKTSSYEKEIEAFLVENNINFERHNREILDGLELDLLCNDIGIEFNGNKFHTEFFGNKGKNYHLNKTVLCNSKNIRLIQIFEDEYKLHKEIVYSKLSHLLGINKGLQRIAGRKCIVKAISKKDAFEFLEKNHIQGFVSSTVYLGAVFDGKLVSVMTFLKEKDDNWNLTRFASLNGYVCQGIGGKLFKNFIRLYNPFEIKSFADRRWTLSSEDNVYIKLGFKLDSVLEPDYRYYNEKVDKYKRFHKFGFRKQILHKKYGFPLSMTELEMAKSLGYDRIWDCGLFKYVWRRED